MWSARNIYLISNTFEFPQQILISVVDIKFYRRFFQWKASYTMRKDEWTYGRADMEDVMVVPRNTPNAPNLTFSTIRYCTNSLSTTI
jgi:hypothetical protein